LTLNIFAMATRYGYKVGLGLLISPRRLLADILYRALELNAYQCAKFNFLARFISDIWRGPKNKKNEAADPPYAT